MSEEIPVGRLVSIIVSVLSVALLVALSGLVVLGLAGGDQAVRTTLTHVIEMLLGVFIGIASARLASNE